MQLDRTFIGIRQRSPFEVWDLTLQVTSRHIGPLFTLFLIGIIPWIVINHLLTMWMVSDDFYEDHAYFFYWMNACLVVSQAQIGTFWIAHYLGQAMFQVRPSVRDTVASVWKLKHKFFFGWLHLMNRLVIPILIATSLMLTTEEEGLVALLGGFIVPVMVFVALIVRGRTPYLNEILLLEEAPRKSDAANVQSYSKRSSNLLSAPGADFFVKFFLAAIIGTAMTLGIYESLCLLDGILGLQSIAAKNMNFIYWQISIWLAAGLVAVNRFLSYIDLRIRTEGWAVRLRLMAEEKRLLLET